MDSPFYWVPTHWSDRGYFAPSAPIDDPILQNIGDVPFWMEVQGVLTEAKSGRFSRLERLLDIHQATAGSHLLPWVCAQILGAAGTPSCFSRMIQEMDDSIDPNFSGDFCKFLKEDALIDYEDRVLAQYETLRKKFGPDQIILLHGEHFGVVSMVQRWLRGLKRGG